MSSGDYCNTKIWKPRKAAEIASILRARDLMHEVIRASMNGREAVFRFQGLKFIISVVPRETEPYYGICFAGVNTTKS